MHKSTEDLLAFFKYKHLPERLQKVSKPFADLAQIVAASSEHAQVDVALQKLIEAKDCAVRAVL